MATKAPVYKVIPTIELQASDIDYNNQLDAAIFLAKFDHQEICFVSNDGRQIFCNRSLLSIFSTSIRNILDSSLVHQIPDTTPIIIVPDCSGDSISKVHDILLNGSTRCSITSFNDINNVIETAKALGIEMKDLGFVPYSSLEQRRPIPQHIPKPIAPTVEPNTAYKVTIPQSVDNIEVKKEKVDDDISIVGFAGDPSKAIPLNIKVENPNDKVAPEVEQDKVSTLASYNGVSMKHKKKKKKKHLKSSIFNQNKPASDDLQKLSISDETVFDKRHKMAGFGNEKFQINSESLTQNIRPLSVPSLSRAKNNANFARPESVDEYRPLSAKSVEVNKIHHARIAEMSDEELSFTSNTNYFTPPYTKTSITNPVQEEESVTMVSPDFFEEPDIEDQPDYENMGSDNLTSALHEEVKVSDFSSAVPENSNNEVHNNESPHEKDVVMKTIDDEEVPVSFVEEEILPVSCQEASNFGLVDENEVGPMRPLTEELLKANHVDENDEKTNHEVGEDANVDVNSDLEESGINDSSYYTDDMEFEKFPSEESPDQESFYGFPDVQTSDNDDQNLMQINPSQFGEEGNVSEIEDVELQIRQLEKELDNTMDNEAEEPSSVQVPRTYEFQEPPKDLKAFKDFSSDEENSEDFFDYDEATMGKNKTSPSVEPVQVSSDINDQKSSDVSKSLLVDNYINRLIEEDMKDVVDKEKSKNSERLNGENELLDAPASSTSVTEELEKIFGEGVEEFDEQMKNCSSTSLPNQSKLENRAEENKIEEFPTSSNKAESIFNSLVVSNPSEKLANLIGNNSISIGRMSEPSKRKPDYSSDYSSLRIERVKAKDIKPKVKTIEQPESQSLRIERVGSSERIKARPKHESWTTEKRSSSRRSGSSSPLLTEKSEEIEQKPKEKIDDQEKPSEDLDKISDEISAEILRDLDNKAEFTAPKRYRSKSPSVRSGIDSKVADSNLEMSIAKRSKKAEKLGNFKASNLDLQINKLKQTYADVLTPRTESEIKESVIDEYSLEKTSAAHVEKDLSSMTIPQLLQASKAAQNPHSTNQNMQLSNHTCVICKKSDFPGNLTNRMTNIKAHYCGHFRTEILDLHKNDIIGNTCMVDGCGHTIVDKSDQKRNLARHIGSSHNKIYKILKLRGHKIDFLKAREDKQAKSKEKRVVERKSDVGNKVPSVVKPANEKKMPLKTADKIECNFCSRKYSNNFNLRKHILAAHDKMLD